MVVDPEQERERRERLTKWVSRLQSRGVPVSQQTAEFIGRQKRNFKATENNGDDYLEDDEDEV